MYNAYQAFATASTHGQFANSYDTLSISTCWGGALHLDPGSSTAQTPSHWRNIYISGLQTDGSTKIPLTTHPVILVANDDGQVFDALHIEDSRDRGRQLDAVPDSVQRECRREVHEGVHRP